MLKKIIGWVFVGLLWVQPSCLQAGTAPDFTLPRLDGTGSVSLKDYHGKVVLIDLWASWCGPCRISFPLYNDLYRELKDKGFDILAINMDPDISDAKDYLKLHPVDYTILSDPQGTVGTLFGASSMPFAILVGRDGQIVSTHAGFYENTFKTEIAPQIRALVVAGS